MAYPRIRRTLSFAALAAAACAASIASPAAAEGACTSSPRPAAPTPPPAARPPRTGPRRSWSSPSPPATRAACAGHLRGGRQHPQGGAASARVTLRSYPGERAEIVGIFYLARTAPYVTGEGLWLNGRNSQAHPSSKVTRRTRVPHDDVTNGQHRHLLHPYDHATGPVVVRPVIERPYPSLRPAAGDELRPRHRRRRLGRGGGSRTTGSTTTPTGASTSTRTRRARSSRATSSRATARA